MLTHAKLCQPQEFPAVGLGDHRVTGTVIHRTQCECPALGLPGVNYLDVLAATGDAGNISQRGRDMPEVTVSGDPKLMLSQVMGAAGIASYPRTCLLSSPYWGDPNMGHWPSSCL